jgi:hypothetical protein
MGQQKQRPQGQSEQSRQKDTEMEIHRAITERI